jgi:glycosyltransferase involved in cell wall biosynthesis
MLELRPPLRLLFVEQPIDVVHSLRHGRRPAAPPLRPLGDSGRLWAVTPRKWLPRRVWPRGDAALASQVLRACDAVGLTRPVLWINDSTFAPLIDRTGWPSVYDVTDDWLLVGTSPRERARQERNDARVMARADRVVVCSPALAGSRGRLRPVDLISNGVDLGSLRAPTPRPDDLPSGRVLLYQGTLSADRLDLELCLDVARSVEGRATLVLVGPNSLGSRATATLTAAGAAVLGPRPYRDVPAYLQHADLLVVPHAVTPFVESLDPIKAREFLAVGRPVVSTPVAGFRQLDPPISAVPRDRFVDEVVARLTREPEPPGPGPLVHEVATWSEQAEAFLRVLDAAASGSDGHR